MLLRISTALLCIASVTCGKSAKVSKALAPAVLEGLEKYRASFDGATGVDIAEEFPRAIVEAELLVPECATIISDFATASPPEKMTDVTAAWGICKFACPSRTTLAALGDMSKDQAASTAAADCAALGPDRIFGTNAAARTRSVLGSNYLVYRFLVDTLATSLMADGSPRALALWARYKTLLPTLGEYISRQSN